jgi:predicted DNA-binding transcriptional regulator AlpA
VIVFGVPASPAGDVERLAGALDIGKGQAPAEDLCPGQIVGVADELGVSPMRIRQMVNEGKLPEPTNLGTRFYVWHRADVAAVKAQQTGQASSPASGLLRPPAQRLTRVRDELLHVEVWREPLPVHLRVWHGPAPEGRRTVVLLGGASVNAHLEEIVRAAAGLLPVSPREAVWFGYRPGDELRPQEVDNLIWRPTSDDEDRTPSAGGRVRHFFRRTAPVRRADQVPRYHRPASLPEVERIVGSPVEAYPGPAYTPETIEAWQRTGRQVEVVRDSIAFESLLTAATTLHWITPSIHDVERLGVLNAVGAPAGR